MIKQEIKQSAKKQNIQDKKAKKNIYILKLRVNEMIKQKITQNAKKLYIQDKRN